MVNEQNQGFPEVELTVNRLYVRGPRRVFYEERRGNPIRSLSYREVEMLWGIDPIDIQCPRDSEFHFVTDKVERKGISLTPPAHLYMKAGKFYVGYPRDDAALEVRREELAQIGIDERLVDYQNSLDVGNGYFAIRLISSPFFRQ